MNKITNNLDFKKIYQHIQQENVEVFIDREFGNGKRRTLKFDWDGNSYIAKLFYYDASIPLRGVKPWLHDEQILQALQNVSGLISPKTFGFESWQEGDQTVTLYLREYLEGTEMKSIDTRQVPAMAKYLAQLHQHGITSNDPYMYNFIIIESQPLIIDFGKASQQSLKSVQHHYFVARELFKLFRGTLHYDEQLIELFWLHYFAQRETLGCFSRALLKLSIKLLYLRQKIRSKGRKRKFHL